MNKLAVLAAVCILSGCGCIQKSEEAIVIKVDTASMLKGRTIDATVNINNSQISEVLR